MCLSRVTSKDNLPKATGYGWKVMIILEDVVVTLCYREPLMVDYWNKDVHSYMIASDDYNNYMNGYHIFSTRKAARIYAKGWPHAAIYRVKYRHIVATGHQYKNGEILPTLVVREIMLLPRTKKAKVKA